MAQSKNTDPLVVRVPFIGVPTQRNTGFKDQRYVNMVVEAIRNEKAGDSKFYIRRRPGLTFASQPSGGAANGRGIYAWNNDLYSVFGNKIYKNGTALSPTLAGTTGMCDFMETSAIASTPYLAMNDGSSLYLINSAGTVTTVSDPDYPTTNNLGLIMFFDGYMFVGQTQGYIWNSANEDPTSWNSLSFISAQRYPDKLTAIARQNDILVAFGEWSTELFFDAGIAAPASPLQRLDQGALQVGCASKDTVIQHENFIIWVARAQTGGYTVQKLDGITNLQRISDAPLERFLNSEGANISAAWAYAFRAGGHFYYIFTLPGLDRTFVYDLEQAHWTEWQTGSSGHFQYVSATQFQGVEYIQHQTNGKLYTVDPDVYQDDGVPISVLLQTNPVDFDTMKRKFYSRFEVIGDQEDDNTIINVSYSDDNYKTWSVPRPVDMKYRAWLTLMGQSRRRAWKLENSSNTPLRLEGYEVEFTLGDY